MFWIVKEQCLTKFFKRKSTTTGEITQENPSACEWILPVSQRRSRRKMAYVWRQHTHPHIQYTSHSVASTCIFFTISHLQQLLVLVSTGEGLRTSGRGEIKSIFIKLGFEVFDFFNQFVSAFLCVCLQWCKVHTIWCLCVTDGRHCFQGRFQRKLNIGDHWAEGGRLLCGDLHGKYIKKGSQTQRHMQTHTHTTTSPQQETEKTNTSTCMWTNKTAQVRAQTTERQKTCVNVNIEIKDIQFVNTYQLSKTSICAFTYSYMLYTCFVWPTLPSTTPTQARLHPRPVLAAPDASHLLGAHQEADRLASVSVGRGVDVGVGTGRAGCAVSGQAG